MHCRNFDIMGSQVRLRVVESGSRLRLVKKMSRYNHVLLMYQSLAAISEYIISLLSAHRQIHMGDFYFLIR
jgi:hypothetical protein